MKSVSSIFSAISQRVAYYVLTRSIRKTIVKIMIGAERNTKPQDAVRWLLEVYDLINLEIDAQCIQWGDGVHIKHELMDGIHAFFYERIPHGSKVLDLGCGNGALAFSIVEHANAKVLGIDFNAAQIEFGKKRFLHPDLELMVGDVFTDIPKDGVFDVIVLSSVLEHLKDRSEFLKKLTERFKPRKFLIRVPTLERHFSTALKLNLGLFPYVDSTHELEYSPKIFYDEMAQAGLKINHFEIRWADIWAECVPAE
jgi:2-polyprenyl-3-methyl-5-hydroxy-6-metoxy-1,4-benzoquinol methylase